MSLRAAWLASHITAGTMFVVAFGCSLAAAQDEEDVIEAADSEGALARALAPWRAQMDACIFADNGEELADAGSAVFVWQVGERGAVEADTRVTPANLRIETCLHAIATQVDLSALPANTRVETRIDYAPGSAQREREVFDTETGEAVGLNLRERLGRDWDRASRPQAEVLEGPVDAEQSRLDVERVIAGATPGVLTCFDGGRGDDADSVTVAIAVDAAGPPSTVEARGQFSETEAARCIVRRLEETLFDAPRAGGIDLYWTFSAPRVAPQLVAE